MVNFITYNFGKVVVGINSICGQKRVVPEERITFKPDGNLIAFNLREFMNTLDRRNIFL